MQGVLKATIAAAMLTASTMATAASFVVMGAPGANLHAAVAKAGGTVTRRLGAIDAVVAEGRGNFKAAIEKQAGVESVVPNVRVSWKPGITLDAASVASAGVPADTIGSGDAFLGLQWGLGAVQAPEAWALGYRGAGARVAVLDSGFILTHPELAGRIDTGCTTDLTGEGLEQGLSTMMHGMHVAGIIAASANGVGTVGVAPEATLCLVKVVSADGSGDIANVAAGMIHAADQNVDVVNVSVGSLIHVSGVPGEYSAKEAKEYLRLIERAAKYAYKRGSLVIAAAGNDALDRDADKKLIRLPTDAREVLAVSATAPSGWLNNPTTSPDEPTSYSNWGDSVDLAAPGGEQRESVPGVCSYPGVGAPRPCSAFDLVFSTGGRIGAIHTYYWSAGTSMAAAHATGVAALIVSKYGRMHPAQLRAYLNAGAEDRGVEGKDPVYGVGRVNALISLSQ
jgi:subtilisin family serine protease